MDPTVDQILTVFDQLPIPEQKRTAVEIWKRLKTRQESSDELECDEVWEGEIPKLTDEELSDIADELALMYEREEQQDGCS